MDKSICKRIRELRKSMKLTQGQFAELVDLSEDSIGKIERGITVPTMKTLYKISKSLNLSVEEILAKEVPPRPHSKALNDFIAYLKSRSDEDVKFIHELAVMVLGRKNKPHV